MTTAVLGVPATVSEELINEIDSIKVETGSPAGDVTYSPEAFTREGSTD